MMHKPFEIWKKQQDRKKRNAITFRCRPTCVQCGRRAARWIIGSRDDRESMQQGWEKREDLAFLCGRCRWKMGGNVAVASTQPLPSLQPLKYKMLTPMTAELAQWIAKYADEWGISRAETVRQAVIFFQQHEEKEDEKDEQELGHHYHAKKNGMDKPKKYEDFDEWYDGSVDGN